jgi:hypothetical protein
MSRLAYSHTSVLRPQSLPSHSPPSCIPVLQPRTDFSLLFNLTTKIFFTKKYMHVDSMTEQGIESNLKASVPQCVALLADKEDRHQKVVDSAHYQE